MTDDVMTDDDKAWATADEMEEARLRRYHEARGRSNPGQVVGQESGLTDEELEAHHLARGRTKPGQI